MQIDRIYYPTETLGYGNRISIWTIGCPRKCFGCSNPELQASNSEKDINVDSIVDIIVQYKDEIDGITLTGGDPFFQCDDLKKLLTLIRPIISGDILVFTGYDYEDIKNDEAMSSCLDFIDVLIDGVYIDDLNDNIGLRGSSNQRIIILNDKFKSRYLDAEHWKRKSQVVIANNNIVSIGIPVSNRK